MEHKNADVVVIGAGPAGVCAALAAARQGAKTILVGNRPSLGGNSSSEVRVWTRGATGAGNLYAEEMGVWGDFKMRNLYTNPIGNPVLWDEVLLDLCLAEKNLELLLNTHIHKIEMAGMRLGAVQGPQLGSEREYRLVGKMFVDCTGDGTIGSLAGVPFRIGKEAQDEYGESHAPPKASGHTQGNTILFFVKQNGAPTPFIAPTYAYSMREVQELIGRGGRILSEEQGGSDYWWFEYGGTCSTIDDAQDIAMELKRLTMGVWNYIKNSGHYAADELALEWVGSYPGKRESRRMVTDYVLRQKDLTIPSRVFDAAFYGGWYMDFHPSEGFAASGDSCEQVPVNIYPVPLRSLYNSRVPNLLFAGRNIGASHVAFSSSRVMNTCALSGQAAGTAAAFCAASGCETPGIAEAEAAAIRRLLQREDMFVPGFAGDDPENLAQAARVSASSFSNGACGEPSGAMVLEEGCFLMLPYRPGMQSAEVLLSCGEDAVLKGSWHASPLPSRYLPGEKAGVVEVLCAEGAAQWTELPLPQLAQACFLTLVLGEAEEVVLHTEVVQRTGLLCGHRERPDYHYPCLRANFGDLYAPSSVLNGYSRPWNGPNLWVSDEEAAPWLAFAWDVPRTIGEVRLYFNPDLCREIPSSRAEKWSESHRFAPRGGMPPELIRDFDIFAVLPDGTQQPVAVVQDNWRRMAVVRLEKPLRAAGLKILFKGTYGARRAEVFEVRVYSDALT